MFDIRLLWFWNHDIVNACLYISCFCIYCFLHYIFYIFLFNFLIIIQPSVHWNSVFLARQEARMASHQTRQKNYGSHTIARARNIGRVNCRKCTYFFPKQTDVCERDTDIWNDSINLFHVTGVFLYPLKISQKRPVGWNELQNNLGWFCKEWGKTYCEIRINS